MGVSKIVERKGKLCCSECLMRLNTLTPQCAFCGSTFSNYEEMIDKFFLAAETVIPQEQIQAMIDNLGDRSNV